MDERLIQVRELLSGGELERAYKVASKIKNPYWRDYAFRWIAEAYALRSPERAIEIASRISTESIRDEVFRTLSYVFSRERNFKLAIKAAREIKNQFLMKKALKSVSDMLAKVIVERGSPGISLGELGLDEEDIEHLKPLPAGIVFKDGKLMPGAEMLRLKGEVKTGVVPRFEKPKKPPEKPSFKEFKRREENYLLEYFLELEEAVDVHELEKWGDLVEEPLKSLLLERAGLLHIKLGNVEDAVRTYQRTRYAPQLGRELAFLFIDEPEKAVGFLGKTPRGLARLLFVWELAVNGIYTEELYRKALGLEKNDYLFARILKFLAFELLDESKRWKDDQMRGFSKRLFDEGVRIQREFELRLLESL